jgi:hypothetical protein
MLNILQSFLAFAAAMLVLATPVTLIIEIVARIFRRRYRIFTHLLRQLFKKELQPLIESIIKARPGEDPDKIAAEIECRIDIFLAFTINLEAHRLFNFYIENPKSNDSKTPML